MERGLIMPNLNWSALKPLQLGRYAEYYAKMEFTSYGYEVYTSEVDDHGVDFIAKSPAGQFLEVQVKAMRNKNYVSIHKDKISLDNAHLVCYIVFNNGSFPDVYIIPATVWTEPNGVFVSYDYKKPEWGINYSLKNAHLLNPYKAENYFSVH